MPLLIVWHFAGRRHAAVLADRKAKQSKWWKIEVEERCCLKIVSTLISDTIKSVLYYIQRGGERATDLSIIVISNNINNKEITIITICI